MVHTVINDKQAKLFGDSEPARQTAWEIAAERDVMTAQVVVGRPVREAYSYHIPDALRERIHPGQRVQIPFGKGNRLVTGFCVDVSAEEASPRRLKSVCAVIDREPFVSRKMLQLTRWVADYYVCGWGQVLESVIPGGVKRQAGTRLVARYQLAEDALKRLLTLKLTPKQQAVIQALGSYGVSLSLEELCRRADCRKSPVDAVLKNGLIEVVHHRTEILPPVVTAPPRTLDFTLNAMQKRALDEILSALRSQTHASFLLHGVTGSGKTEIYIQAIREVVGYGRQAIVLVPEISLTPQTIEQFRRRFESVAVLHSGLTDAERSRQWRQIQRGDVQVVVGARSAVFAPVPHLGLIVVDEEHETSFKQDRTPRYHARDVARQRAELENVPLILGSATPSLESWHRVTTHQDRLLSLPRRVASRPLPPVVVVDSRHDPNRSRGHAIGRSLESAMRNALTAGGQVILFLNLRGHSPTIWCRSCGLSAKCPHCDVTLTWHQDRRVCLCHACGYRTVVGQCAGCERDTMCYLGHGTEKLEKEVRAKFPEHHALRMDSDSMKRFGSCQAALRAFRSGEVRILLGTQMIAKGLDFPNVTLVGVVDADTSLHQPDFRAAERTFQLISQVAGRTGRGEKPGRVYVQTLSPTEPAIQLAAEHNFVEFAEIELKARKELSAPPFRHSARVIVKGKAEDSVREAVNELAATCRDKISEVDPDLEMLGPAPAPIAKIRDHYRYHFQISGVETDQVLDVWKKVLENRPRFTGVEFTIDVDPLNLR